MNNPGQNTDQAPERVSHYVDLLQGTGRYSFTRGEIAEVFGRSYVAIEAALRRLKKKGRIISPRRGFFVIVPVEYRSAGSLPASWFIDELMAYLDQPYYVGLLTAAEIHGAAHNRPQIFQVITNVPTRPVKVARVRIEFHRNRRISMFPTERVKTEAGFISVSTPEGTAIDLVRYPEASGNLDNVATVLLELAERIDPEKLAEVAERARHPDAQRLGYLLEFLGLEDTAEPLARLVASWRRRPVLLRPGVDSEGLDYDSLWYVISNEKVTPDL